MKSKSLVCIALLAGIATATVSFAQNRSPGQNQNRNRDDHPAVDVKFEQPDQFTDLKRNFSAAEAADQGYLRELERYFERTAANRLNQGQKLQVTITDVDMAGEFEPHRGPQFSDVRIVKDIYPPRIHLRFTLTDASGNVVAEGERRLSNLAFAQTVTPISRDDPLRYEKQLIDDFLRDVARKAK